MASGEIQVTPGRILTEEELVTNDKLNQLGTPTLRVKELAITARELADGAINSDKLSVDLEAQLGVADGSVTTAKLAAAAVTTAKMAENAKIPTGSIMEYAGPTEPDGWLFCDGQAISRTTYATLFAAIGGTWGGGDGSTTFNVPDLRGFVTAHRDSTGGRLPSAYVPFGSGGPNVLGAYCGAPYVQLSVAQMPSHAHTFNDLYSYLTTAVQNFRSPTSGGIYFGTANTTAPNGTFGAGGDQVHNNVQFTRIVNKIIRYL